LGLDSSQIYTWRKDLVGRCEDQGLPVPAALKQEVLAFVPVMITPEVSPEPAHAPRRSRRRHRAERPRRSSWRSAARLSRSAVELMQTRSRRQSQPYGHPDHRPCTRREDDGSDPARGFQEGSGLYRGVGGGRVWRQALFGCDLRVSCQAGRPDQTHLVGRNGPVPDGQEPPQRGDSLHTSTLGRSHPLPR
jgi:hypothetical protein